MANLIHDTFNQLKLSPSSELSAEIIKLETEPELEKHLHVVLRSTFTDFKDYSSPEGIKK